MEDEILYTELWGVQFFCTTPKCKKEYNTLETTMPVQEDRTFDYLECPHCHWRYRVDWPFEGSKIRVIRQVYKGIILECS